MELINLDNKLYLILTVKSFTITMDILIIYKIVLLCVIILITYLLIITLPCK